MTTRLAATPPRSCGLAATLLLRRLAAGDREGAATALAQLAAAGDNWAAQLERDRLAGYVELRCRELGLHTRLPAAAKVAFRRAADEQRQRSTRCGELLAMANRQLGAAGIPFLTLKGLNLAVRFFGGRDHRFMWDVDLLVRHEDLGPALAALEKTGYLPPQAAMPGDIRRRGIHAIQVSGPLGALDMHHSLRVLPGIHCDDTLLWSNARGFSIDGTRYPTLSDPDTLLALALGLATDLATGKHNLKKVWDLYMVLRGMDAGTDWGAFFSDRDRDGSAGLVLNMVVFCLYLLDAAEDCPAAAALLGKRREALLIDSRETAVRCYGRGRRHPANRWLLARLLPVSTTRYWLSWAASLPGRHSFYKTGARGRKP